MRRNLILAVVVLGCIGGLLVMTVPGLADHTARMARLQTSDPLGGEAVAVAADPVSQDGEPTLAAYPPPPWPGPRTPLPPQEWVYAAVSVDGIATATLNWMKERGWASSETTIIRAADYTAADAEAVGDSPQDILAGSPVDVAITLSGEIVSWFPSSYGVPETPYPAAVVIVDREDGAPYTLWLYESLEEIPETLRP